MGVRWIILTDLHLGADQDLLPDSASVRHITDQVADRVAGRWRKWRIPPSVRRWLLRNLIGDIVELEGGARIPVYNTGGWVNETAEVQHPQGAQAILVDDSLSVAIELAGRRAALARRYDSYR